jgi:hypothetical protein
MPLGNFRVRLKSAVEQLAVGRGDVKSRLFLAVTNQLVLANVPDVPELPTRFRDELASILAELTARNSPGQSSVQVTLHGMRLARAAGYAERIWTLYLAFENFTQTGELGE